MEHVGHYIAYMEHLEIGYSMIFIYIEDTEDIYKYIYNTNYTGYILQCGARKFAKLVYNYID